MPQAPAGPPGGLFHLPACRRANRPGWQRGSGAIALEDVHRQGMTLNTSSSSGSRQTAVSGLLGAGNSRIAPLLPSNPHAQTAPTRRRGRQRRTPSSGTPSDPLRRDGKRTDGGGPESPRATPTDAPQESGIEPAAWSGCFGARALSRLGLLLRRVDRNQVRSGTANESPGIPWSGIAGALSRRDAFGKRSRTSRKRGRPDTRGPPQCGRRGWGDRPIEANPSPPRPGALGR